MLLITDVYVLLVMGRIRILTNMKSAECSELYGRIGEVCRVFQNQASSALTNHLKLNTLKILHSLLKIRTM